MPYWKLFYHVVWSTKLRESSIDDGIERVIQQSIRSTISAMECTFHAIGLMPDHAHVAVSVPPTVRISDFVGRMKGASAHAVNQLMPASNFGWQSEYGVLSFGERALPDVVEYVKNQKVRHTTNSLWPTMEKINDIVSESALAGL